MNQIILDVSELEAPKPLMKIMEVLQGHQDHTVIVHHRIEPMGLYKRLIEAGYRFETEKKSDSHFVITIFPKDEPKD